MRILLSVAATCMFLVGVGCGMPFETVVGVDGDLLGDDANSNLLRVPLGSVHEVKGSVGRSEGVLSRWTETIDAMTAREPEIVTVERLGATTFRLTAAREGETVLEVVGDGEARTIPIRVMPSAWTPPPTDASPRRRP